MVPVAGNAIEIALGHQRRLGEQAAAALLLVFDEALEQLDRARALRQQDRQTLADDVNRGEVFEIAADLVVIALLGIFNGGEVRGQLLLLRERRAVHALEHLVLAVALPVCAGALDQLERLDRAGCKQVWTCAEVHKVALLVEGDLLALGHAVDEQHLVGLALFLHQLLCLVAGQGEALELQIFLDDLLHLRLDGRQHGGVEGQIAVEVVVEAVVHGGADGQLDFGVEALDRLRQNVGRGVAEDLLALLVFKGVQRDIAVGGERGRQTDELAVYGGREHLAADDFGGGGRVVDGCTRLDRDLSAVGKFDVQHGGFLLYVYIFEIAVVPPAGGE